MSQLTIFDTKPILTVEHNRHGQDESYQENRQHYSNQTEIVLAHLDNGEWVSSKSMFELHQIMDCRARIYSLKKAGYKIVEEKIKGGKGSKLWRLEK